VVFLVLQVACGNFKGSILKIVSLRKEIGQMVCDIKDISVHISAIKNELVL